MASIFEIRAIDIQNKINPEQDPYKFTIGSDEGDTVTEAYVDDQILVQESKVLSLLPELYRVLINKVNGEILTSNALDGQTNLQLSFYPVVANSVELYKNYPSYVSWSLRNKDYLIDSDDYVINESTGEISLVDGLEVGDVVYAYYEHNAALKILWLRDIIIDFCCYELSLQLESITGPEGFKRFEIRHNNAVNWLNDIRDGSKSGISEIDKIEMISSREKRKDVWIDIFGIERPIKDILSK